MKLYFHFAVVGFANTYLIGPPKGGDVILIDPGIMDTELLKLIEGNHYYIRSILITHKHESHVKGVRTLKKIYDADIYSFSPYILDFPSIPLKDGDVFSCASGIKVEVLEVPGHSPDSLVYHIGGMIFTGDVLAAGRVGGTKNSYSRAILLRAISDKLFPLPDSTLVLPGHGPPSTLKAEKMYNPDLQLLRK
ncbi:MAG TPA: MBL fold metallo-hydrolase [Sediminispirochaeta sp.]|nr:MBL fold metallo-hydrolase [Sediminispirochaeta sp.]